EIACYYDEAFANLPHMRVVQSLPEERARSAHHLYIALFDFAALGTGRQRFLNALARHRVGAQVHYIPVYRQPYYSERFGLRPQDSPALEDYYPQCLSLPLCQDMTDEEAERVVMAVREAIGA